MKAEKEKEDKQQQTTWQTECEKEGDEREKKKV